MSIDSIMAVVKHRRSLLSEASNDLWLSDYDLMTDSEKESLHELKLKIIDNDQKAAKLRVENRILNKRRGRK